MTLRLTPEDEQALTLLAEAEGVSKQEATVRAIHEAVSRRVRRERVAALSAAARDRYWSSPSSPPLVEPVETPHRLVEPVETHSLGR